MQILRPHEAASAQALLEIKNRVRTLLERESRFPNPKTIEVFGKPLSPVEVVRTIVEDVKRRGFEAAAEYAQKLDGFKLARSNLFVSREEIRKSAFQVDNALRKALDRAKENIERYQKAFAPQIGDRWIGDGLCGMRVRPLNRVGACVPGGRAPLISTVLMNVIPARIAGVKEVAVITPPDKNGDIHPGILYACELCEVDQVLRIGGAQGVALLAFGFENFAPVDKIVGPGNLFVQLAKKEVYGFADIDMFGGPSEVLVLADETAKPDWVAADLLSQAEHDPMAACILVTDSEKLAKEVSLEVRRQIPLLSRPEAAREAIDRYGRIFLTETIEKGIEIANSLAPEHLELVVADPAKISPLLTQAGAIFHGEWTPEPIGDYIAGPSHTLPTGGTARFSSGLSAESFVKRTSLIQYTFDALVKDLNDAVVLAEAETLDAHGRSLGVRKGKRP